MNPERRKKFEDARYGWVATSSRMDRHRSLPNDNCPIHNPEPTS